MSTEELMEKVTMSNLYQSGDQFTTGRMLKATGADVGRVRMSQILAEMSKRGMLHQSQDSNGRVYSKPPASLLSTIWRPHTNAELGLPDPEVWL